jgi:iron(II)-dependent oxidoreductase
MRKYLRVSLVLMVAIISMMWGGQAQAQNAPTTRVDSAGVKQVYVPAGCFTMGSDPSKDANTQTAEKPAHEVCITQPYWMDQSEVTNAAFDAFVKAGGYTQQNLWSSEGWKWLQSQPIKGPDTTCGPNFSAPQQPRVCVSYYEAQAYAKWRGGSLPTEAQWEYAARGTDGRIYPWGNTWNPAGANINTTGISKTTPVCSYPAGNSWSGACDMAGNVWEWVNDWYSDQYYALLVKNDPTGAPGGVYHVLRGGAWDADTIAARSAIRGGSLADYHLSSFGFRIVTGVSAAPISTATPAPTQTPTPIPTATTTAIPQLGLGSTQVDSFGVKQVYVPAGCFTMGSDPNSRTSELPAHQVCITQSYWLDQSEVTNAAFDAFVKAGGYTQQNLWSVEGWAWLQSQPIKDPDTTCTSASSAPQQPHICVSYYEAQAYAKWRGGSLPTEAQWEYAARGTDGRIFPWGNTWDVNINANINTSEIGKTAPVCSYPTGNSWVGACDMAGNAWEWVNDWYAEQYYTQLVKNDPTGPTSGIYRVLRGGSWNTYYFIARSAFRNIGNPTDRFNDFGFRVIVAAPPSP